MAEGRELWRWRRRFFGVCTYTDIKSMLTYVDRDTEGGKLRCCDERFRQNLITLKVD